MQKKRFLGVSFLGPTPNKNQNFQIFFIKISVIKIRFFRGIGKSTAARFARTVLKKPVFLKLSLSIFKAHKTQKKVLEKFSCDNKDNTITLLTRYWKLF